MINCLFVGLGGCIGAICRYLIGLLPLQAESGFPVKTFLINIAGAFLIGCIAACAEKHPQISPQLVLFLKVGICGGFTTFSTFAFETTDLLGNGQIVTGVLYASSSMILGVLAVLLAQLLFH